MERSVFECRSNLTPNIGVTRRSILCVARRSVTVRFDSEELEALEALRELTGADISSVVREAVIEHAKRCVRQAPPRDIGDKRKSLTLNDAFARYSAMCVEQEREAS